MILGVILVLSGYYTWDNFAKLIKSGFSSTGPTAALFVFSVLYFGIMTDAGMFDVIINNHAGPALTMCSTLMAAAVLGRHLPLVIGILSVPFALAFDTDSYFYGMLPVMIGIGEGFGIPAPQRWQSAETARPSSARWYRQHSSESALRMWTSTSTSRATSCGYGDSPLSA